MIIRILDRGRCRNTGRGFCCRMCSDVEGIGVSIIRYTTAGLGVGGVVCVAS